MNPNHETSSIERSDTSQETGEIAESQAETDAEHSEGLPNNRENAVRGFFVGIAITLLITCVMLALLYAVLVLIQKTGLYRKLKCLNKAAPEKFDDLVTNREDQSFEDKWQTERITRKLKQIIEREFIGLKTDLTVDFDERVIGRSSRGAQCLHPLQAPHSRPLQGFPGRWPAGLRGSSDFTSYLATISEGDILQLPSRGAPSLISVVDKIEGMVEATVARKVEELKKEILSNLFPAAKEAKM